MACIDGSKVCINPFKYVGCIFNALLNLDKVAAAMAHIFVDFLQDPLGFVIEVGVAELNSIFNHVKNCYQLFKNGEPTCQKVSSFKSCVSLLLDAFDGASKVVNGLEAAKKNKVVKAIGNVQKLIPEADNMCKLGCKSSMCAADSDSEVTLQYSIPSGCQCRYMEFKNMDGPNTSTDSLMPGVFITSLASTITVTPTYCAMNAAIVNSVTGKADQFNRTFNLDTQLPSTELMRSANSTSGYPNAGDSSKPSSSSKHIGALVCLTTMTTVIALVVTMLV